MNNLTVRRLAGLLLVAVPIIFTIGFTLLQVAFEYPDILRQPTAAGGIAVGLLEAAGWEAAGMINAISYLVWSLWLIVIGALLLVQRPRPGVADAAE